MGQSEGHAAQSGLDEDHLARYLRGRGSSPWEPVNTSLRVWLSFIDKNPTSRKLIQLIHRAGERAARLPSTEIPHWALGVLAERLQLSVQNFRTRSKWTVSLEVGALDGLTPHFPEAREMQQLSQLKEAWSECDMLGILPPRAL